MPCLCFGASKKRDTQHTIPSIDIQQLKKNEKAEAAGEARIDASTQPDEQPPWIGSTSEEAFQSADPDSVVPSAEEATPANPETSNPMSVDDIVRQHVEHWENKKSVEDLLEDSDDTELNQMEEEADKPKTAEDFAKEHQDEIRKQIMMVEEPEFASPCDLGNISVSLYESMQGEASVRTASPSAKRDWTIIIMSVLTSSSLVIFSYSSFLV